MTDLRFNGKKVGPGHLVKIEFGGLVSPDWLVVKESNGGLYASPDPTHPRWISEVTITDHLIPGAFRLMEGDYWNLAVGVDPADFNTSVEVEPECVTVVPGQGLLSHLGVSYADILDVGTEDLLLNAQESARILADPSWGPVEREIEVGDQVRFLRNLNGKEAVETVKEKYTRGGITWVSGVFEDLPTGWSRAIQNVALVEKAKREDPQDDESRIAEQIGHEKGYEAAKADIEKAIRSLPADWMIAPRAVIEVVRNAQPKEES